jgi:hypothetical protein
VAAEGWLLTDNAASDDTMTNERWIWQNVEQSGPNIVLGTITASTWRG